MRRWMLLPVLAILFAVGGGAAQAHECTYSGEEPNEGEQLECHETPVKPNWRDGNYVPLFDMRDRDDSDARKEMQRWRDCQGYDTAGRYYNNQFCVHVDFGNSLSGSPQEAHVWSGGQHCFLFEFAHDCSDHDARLNEGVHDAHGGAAMVDVCLAENPESKYCDHGTADTQAGVVVMDHNPCGTIVPVVACTDEYHVVRPFDDGYTQGQMEDSAEYIPRILADPQLYLCGYEQYRGGNPICPGGDDSTSSAHPALTQDGSAKDAVTRVNRGDADRGNEAAFDATGPRDPLGTETLAVRARGADGTSAPSPAGALMLTILTGLAGARRIRKLATARG